MILAKVERRRKVFLQKKTLKNFCQASHSILATFVALAVMSQKPLEIVFLDILETALTFFPPISCSFIFSFNNKSFEARINFERGLLLGRGAKKFSLFLHQRLRQTKFFFNKNYRTQHLLLESRN